MISQLAGTLLALLDTTQILKNTLMQLTLILQYYGILAKSRTKADNTNPIPYVLYLLHYPSLIKYPK
jgi:hypothetical protein